MKKISKLTFSFWIILALVVGIFINLGTGLRGIKAESAENPQLHYMEFGEYPQSFVGLELNTTLEEGYDELSEKLFGQSAVGYYSANNTITSGVYNEKLNPVFYYQNKKYARVVSLRYSAGSSAIFSDGTVQEISGTVYWFKVEPIQWIILNWENLPAWLNPQGDGKATSIELVAKKAIAVNVPFYSKAASQDTSVWKYSTIRGWLNGIDVSDSSTTYPMDGGNFCSEGSYKGNFINDAFTENERTLILDTTNITNGSKDKLLQSDGTHKEIITTEKIYLLSWTEVFDKYKNVFGDKIASADDERRICQTTDYGKANNARVSDNINGAVPKSTYENYKGNIWWWLRTNLGDGGNCGFVSYAGFENPQLSNNINNAIRPAMRLELPPEPATPQFTVTTAAKGNGSVNQDTLVKKGDNLTIDFKANKGYHVSKIFVGGIELTGEAFNSAKANGYYTIENITEDVAFSVEFEKDAVFPWWWIAASIILLITSLILILSLLKDRQNTKYKIIPTSQ